MPTAESGCDLVKTSTSGPMPTSRYCDHIPRAISASFSRCASSEPGGCRRAPPRLGRDRLSNGQAAAASPWLCSSMTRSSMLVTKVTPQALIACRSTGARKYGSRGSRAPLGVLARISPQTIRRARRRPPAPLQPGSYSQPARDDRRSVLMSWTPSSRRTTTAGPEGSPGNQTRPTRVPRDPSRGKAGREVKSHAALSAPSVTNASRALPRHRGRRHQEEFARACRPPLVALAALTATARALRKTSAEVNVRSRSAVPRLGKRVTSAQLRSEARQQACAAKLSPASVVDLLVHARGQRLSLQTGQ